MVEKLKLILRPIPWSLAAKAIIISAIWYFLPYWLFLIVALYFYFSPLLRSFAFWVPYLIFIFLGFILPPNFGIAIILGLIFALILGIKNLIFINRREAYELAVLLAFFLAFYDYFLKYRFFGPQVIFELVVISVLGFFLLEGLIKYFRFSYNPILEKLISAIVVFLTVQLLVILLFLPFNFYSKLILGYLFFSILVDLSLNYLEGRLTNKMLLFDFSVFFVLTLLILASTVWGL